MLVLLLLLMLPKPRRVVVAPVQALAVLLEVLLVPEVDAQTGAKKAA